MPQASEGSAGATPWPANAWAQWLEQFDRQGLFPFEWQMDDDRLRLAPGLDPWLGCTAAERPASMAELLQRIHPEDRAQAHHAVRSGEPGPVDIGRLAHLEGRWRRLVRADSRMLDGEANPTMIGLWRVLDSREEAPSASALRLIGRASHEIRNPISGIIGLLQLAQQLAASETQRRYLNLALSSARSLIQVLEQTIELSRLADARPDAEARWFDLDEVLCEAARAATPTMGWKDFSLVYDFQGEPVEVCSDMIRLRQIVLNLIGNAARHTVQGHIGLSAVVRPVGPGRAECRISVEDTGVGIAAHRLEALFVPFEHATEARLHGGHGLGLSIVHGLVGALGGQIGVRSTVGQGTVFEMGFEWPCRDPGSPRPPMQAGHAWLVYRPPSVEGAEWLARRLARVGWTSTMLPTVEDAVETAAIGPNPQLLLLAAHSVDDAAAVTRLDAALPNTRRAMVSRLDWAHPAIEEVALRHGWTVVPVPVSQRDLLHLTAVPET